MLLSHLCLVSISLTEVGRIVNKNQPEFIAFPKKYRFTSTG